MPLFGASGRVTLFVGAVSCGVLGMRECDTGARDSEHGGVGEVLGGGNSGSEGCFLVLPPLPLPSFWLLPLALDLAPSSLHVPWLLLLDAQLGFVTYLYVMLLEALALAVGG